MDTKLTLKMDATVVRRMKSLAGRRQESVSRMTERYYRALTSREANPKGVPQPKGAVADIAGLLKGARLGDLRDEVARHILEKHR